MSDLLCATTFPVSLSQKVAPIYVLFSRSLSDTNMTTSVVPAGASAHKIISLWSSVSLPWGSKEVLTSIRFNCIRRSLPDEVNE